MLQATKKKILKLATYHEYCKNKYRNPLSRLLNLKQTGSLVLFCSSILVLFFSSSASLVLVLCMEFIKEDLMPSFSP
jgi:hypothetical protein